MNHVVIINDGQKVFHLGLSKEVSITTKGIYYTFMSISPEKTILFNQKELLTEYKIKTTEFRDAQKELAKVKLCDIDKHSGNKYINIYNLPNVRKEIEPDYTLKKELNAYLMDIAKRWAVFYMRKEKLNYNPKLIYAWSAELKKLLKIRSIELKELEEKITWIENNSDSLYIPSLPRPHMLHNKWSNLDKTIKIANDKLDKRKKVQI